MKKRLFTRIFMSLFFLLCFQGVAQAETLDKVVAIVNSEPITQNELTQQMTVAKDQMASAHMPIPNNTVLRKRVLDQLIDMKLQLQIAQKAHIAVTDAQLNTTITSIAANNHLTVSQLKAAIEQHNMSFADYQAQIRKEMMLTQVAQMEVIPSIKFTDAEVAQVKAQLIKKGAKGDLDKQAKMFLLKEKYPEAMKNWLDQLRSQAYVKIINP
ncbi:MAG TPA: SurA N-terminal domain-containing protein [Gammaproteobacteria bacterium]|nr:SurA N-terminal domain-containing protein [Gammaproteobacteria bacterium]